MSLTSAVARSAWPPEGADPSVDEGLGGSDNQVAVNRCEDVPHSGFRTFVAGEHRPSYDYVMVRNSMGPAVEPKKTRDSLVTIGGLLFLAGLAGNVLLANLHYEGLLHDLTRLALLIGVVLSIWGGIRSRRK